MAHTAQEMGGDPVVLLATDGAVPMGLLHDVQADLLKVGLTDVIYVGESGKKLKMSLPPTKAKEKLAGLPEDMILPVKVDAAGVLTVRGKKIKGASLPDVIKKELQMNDKLVVTLHTERDTRYGAFLQVLGGLKEGGATRIAIQDPSS
jgi:biopolymer transport protein ExbD